MNYDFLKNLLYYTMLYHLLYYILLNKNSL